MVVALSLAQWSLGALAVALAVYALAVGLLIAFGRRVDARALAGFIPDCIVLVGRLAADPRVPRRAKLLLALLAGYLALPFDLVPDFIPVAGQLADAIVVALVLRIVVRAGGRELLDEHWPGPARSRALIQRLAYPAPADPPAAAVSARPPAAGSSSGRSRRR